MAGNSGDSNMDLTQTGAEDLTNTDTTTTPIGTAAYEKSQSLVDIANNTFKELCRTLENEQTKLQELEERRKKLQEEMQRLKTEIEEEKHSYRLNIIDSVMENLDAMNASSSSTTSVGNAEVMELDGGASVENVQSRSQLDTCYEVDENNDDAAAATTSSDFHPLETVANDIRRQLQNVITECIIEQCQPDEQANELETAES